MLHINDTKNCFSSHMGAWLVDTETFSGLVQAIKSGIYAEHKIGTIEDSKNELYIKDGLAVLTISGMMQKSLSKFGGTSTVALRKQIRAVMNDSSVKRVLLQCDSGGGYVAGTKELADDLKALNAIKPITAYIEDLGASACYWAVSQCSKIVANEMAFIGSLGVFSVVQDSSGMYEREGVKVHVVATGEHKGTMAEGAAVTDDMLAEMKTRIMDMHEIFMNSVAEGRGMSRQDVDILADGRIHIASKALEMGLIDSIATLDDTVLALTNDISLEYRRNNAFNKLNNR